MPYPNMLAGGITSEVEFSPFELFAGESDIVTSQGTAGAVALEQFRVVARANDGTLIAWDGVTVAGRGKPFGFTAQPIPAATQGPIFVGGFFNHLALIWPDAVSSLSDRKAAFDGTDVHIGAIMGVGTHITYATPTN